MLSKKRNASICLAVSGIQHQHMLKAHQQSGVSFNAYFPLFTQCSGHLDDPVAG